MTPTTQVPPLSQRIPEGSCVVFDQAILATAANRFHSAGCPVMDDAYGQWLADDPSNPPSSGGPLTAPLLSRWRTDLRRADFQVEGAPESDFIPWTPDLLEYLESRYVLVYSQPGAVLYEKVDELYAR